MFDWHENILATHEEPQAVAYPPYNWPGNDFLGVALPCEKAMGLYVEVRYLGLSCVARVLDLGPWCIDDEEYVMGMARPRAEQFRGTICPRRRNTTEVATVQGMIMNQCNAAGIDLFPGTARFLNIPSAQNVRLDWKFHRKVDS